MASHLYLPEGIKSSKEETEGATVTVDYVIHTKAGKLYDGEFTCASTLKAGVEFFLTHVVAARGAIVNSGTGGYTWVTYGSISHIEFAQITPALRGKTDG